MAGPGAIISFKQSPYDDSTQNSIEPNNNGPLPLPRINSGEKPKLHIPIHFFDAIHSAEEEFMATPTKPILKRRPDAKAVFTSFMEEDIKPTRIPLATMPPLKPPKLDFNQLHPRLRRSVSDDSLTSRRCDEKNEKRLNQNHSLGIEVPRKTIIRRENILMKEASTLAPCQQLYSDRSENRLSAKYLTFKSFFDSLPFITDKHKAKNYKTKFLKLWNKENIDLKICLSDLVDQAAEKLIRSALKTETQGQKLIPINDWLAKRIALYPIKPFKEIADKVPDDLIGTTPIFPRLKYCHEFLLRYAIEQKAKTHFTDYLAKALEKLLCMRKSRQPTDFLLSEDSRLNIFLKTISKLENGTFNPLKVGQNFKAPAEAKVLIMNLLGKEKHRSELFNLLSKFASNKEISTRLMKNLVSVALETISSIEHSWSEPAVHELIPMPFSEITIPSILNLYNREGEFLPLTINGMPLFAEDIKVVIQPVDYFKHLFSKLHETLGLKISNRLLKRDVEFALSIPESGKKHDLNKFVPSMLRCFNLLKMGMTDAWMRSNLLLTWRLDELLNESTGGFRMANAKTQSFNFQITAQGVSVQQIKNIQIVLNASTKVVPCVLRASLEVMEKSSESTQQVFLTRILESTFNQKVDAEHIEKIRVLLVGSSMSNNELVQKRYFQYQSMRNGLKWPNNESDEAEFIKRNYPQGGVTIGYNFKPLKTLGSKELDTMDAQSV